MKKCFSQRKYIFLIVEFIVAAKFHAAARLIIINAPCAFYDLIAPEAVARYTLIYDFTPLRSICYVIACVAILYPDSSPDLIFLFSKSIFSMNCINL